MGEHEWNEPADRSGTKRSQLTRLRIAGFRSLRDVELNLTSPTTLLIGPNGSGKSNLLSALRMIPLMRTQSLGRFVGEQGGASSLLHYGSGTTKEIEIELTFKGESGENTYAVRLGYAAGDKLIFLDEVVTFRANESSAAVATSFGAGHSESLLAEHANEPGATTARVVNSILSRFSFFHFHDTSMTAPLRQNARQTDDRYLRSDGSNLAAFLYRLRNGENGDSKPAWNLIEGVTKRVAPFIKALEPDLVNPDNDRSAVRLYWVDERDHRFDVHDLSDGTLRAIALIAALCQPSATLPQFITIDEPELGLHPAALSLVASIIRSVSVRSQVLVSTQSRALLDEFEAEDVVVVERRGGESMFRPLVGGAVLSSLRGTPK